jgi:hypothetical protein
MPVAVVWGECDGRDVGTDALSVDATGCCWVRLVEGCS